ncbi:hypothetical protein P0136_07205 [Lentisphaerota bacterium ZTH]|nr:hypothetical protein JYG24_01680 [Lentisphaerota bacterium]WET05155.1 hypothetical protein P0136_07205 [Lentisphaerota bacterium ZTH]
MAECNASGKKSSLGGKLLASLFFFIFLAAGLAFTGFMVFSFYQGVVPMFWDKLPA